MTASQNIKTPSMTLPMKDEFVRLHARQLARRFDPLCLSDLLAVHRPDGGLRVTERLRPRAPNNPSSLWCREYRVRLHFVDPGTQQHKLSHPASTSPSLY